MKYFVLLVSLLCGGVGYAQSVATKVTAIAAGVAAPPKIGLTLSGGGAKGLAHIGILEAIDSAGLRVDYITGTSMGSIIGSLYAVGYSGKDVERIARSIDWASLFSGKPSLRNVNMDEKDEVENYALEVPLEKGKIKIYSGIIEGQEIWLKFQELFLPIYDIKDFSKFSIPFKCVATDVGTGQPVVLDQGEVVTAIRSSMAIPSVFTAIDYKDTKLVDGGLVRNFPVKDVKDMGADVVIGVNLSQGLHKAKDLNSAIDVLYQIGFYKDADDFENQRKLCDVYIMPPVTHYSAASFGSADSLIQIGKETGNKYYPIFKRMADSLRAIYPDYAPVKDRLPKHTYVILDSIHINGLKKTTRTGFTNRLNLELGQPYNGVNIAEAVRKVYGSQNFKRIAYRWQPTKPGHANLEFDVIESPLTTIKGGLHYNSYGKVALVGAIASKNFLFDRSKSMAKVNISENFRVLAEQTQTFGKRDNNNVIVSVYHERMNLPGYQDFSESATYRSNLTRGDVKLQHNVRFSSTIGIGSSFETQSIKPKVAPPDSTIKGSNSYFHSYIFFEHNTLNKKVFTTGGWYIFGSGGYVYNQRPGDLYFTLRGFTGQAPLSFDNYWRFRLKVENYQPLTRRLTLQTALNAGVNTNAFNAYLNFFNVGGLTDFVRSQYTFAGLNEFTIVTHSVATLSVAFQYEFLKSFYGTARANIGGFDFWDSNLENLNSKNFISGYALTAGYNSGIGPISISIMYSDQSQKILGYVNVGFHF